MKIFEFASENQPKASPYCDDMNVLIKKAQEGVDSGNITVVQIPVSKLLTTQAFDEDLTISDHDYNEYDSLPFAVLLDGYYHLLDGHKRVNDGINEGNSRVLLLVTDADSAEDELDESKHKHKKKHHLSTTPVIPFYNRWWYGGYYGHNDLDHDNDGDHDSDDQETETGGADAEAADTGGDAS